MLIAIVLATLLGAGANKPVEVVVSSVARVGCQSGMVACWDRITVTKQDGSSMDLFALSMTGVEERPRVGQTCRTTYHSTRLEGSYGDRLPTTGPWLAIDEMSCGDAAPARP